MDWFTRKVDKWASDKQRTEMADFVARLRAMDGVEIGNVVAVATHFRHSLEDDGHNPMDPIAYVAVNPGFPLFLSATASRLEKLQKKQEAAAFMIWTHTARAGARLELRGLGREMWRELSRGFPHVKKGAQDFRSLTGIHLNIADAEQFPFGLAPDSL